MTYKAYIHILSIPLFYTSCTKENGLNMSPMEYFNSVEYIEGRVAHRSWSNPINRFGRGQGFRLVHP